MRLVLRRLRFGEMVGMMELIKNTDQLREWLEDKPASWAQVVAVRLALRMLPLAITSADRSDTKDVPLAVFRAIIVSWAARNYPVHDMTSSARAAYAYAESAASLLSNETAAHAAKAAAYAAYAAKAADYAVYAANVADTAAEVANANNHLNSIVVSDVIDDNKAATFAEVDKAAKRDAIYKDCEWLSSQSDTDGSPRVLSNRSLWLGEPSTYWRRSWADAAEVLRQLDPTYNDWIDWYERRIRGENAAFEIPGDKGRTEDKWLLRKLADASDEDFWGRGAEYVNRQLAEWLEEARERAAKNLVGQSATLSNREAAIARVRTIASPEFIDADGKADARPNQRYDQPRFGCDLADLPITLQSLARSLSASLPTQASPLVRTGLNEYENELRVRGPRPILGLLNGQIEGMACAIFTKPSLAKSDDPADWDYIDESEWGPGAAKLFTTFFAYHRDLMDHFPLDEAREEVLRETEIDGAAATGKTLSEPMETLAALIRDLHAQNMATDNILLVVEAMAQHTRNVADMPAPPGDLPANYVSPQKRAALNNTGLLFEFYGFLGSTASLAAWVQTNQPLMNQLQNAAFALGKLIP